MYLKKSLQPLLSETEKGFLLLPLSPVLQGHFAIFFRDLSKCDPSLSWITHQSPAQLDASSLRALLAENRSRQAIFFLPEYNTMSSINLQATELKPLMRLLS
jgi:hypothetical protein